MLTNKANTWTGIPDPMSARSLAVRTFAASPILAVYIAISVKSTDSTADPRPSACALTKIASGVPDWASHGAKTCSSICDACTEMFPQRTERFKVESRVFRKLRETTNESDATMKVMIILTLKAWKSRIPKA